MNLYHLNHAWNVVCWHFQRFCSGLCLFHSTFKSVAFSLERAVMYGTCTGLTACRDWGCAAAEQAAIKHHCTSWREEDLGLFIQTRTWNPHPCVGGQTGYYTSLAHFLSWYVSGIVPNQTDSATKLTQNLNHSTFYGFDQVNTGLNAGLWSDRDLLWMRLMSLIGIIGMDLL